MLAIGHKHEVAASLRQSVSLQNLFFTQCVLKAEFASILLTYKMGYLRPIRIITPLELIGHEN
jgi:hypothetical protein